jgi:alkylation response protein AidB-like acyl-CoA dehydrogenase
MELELPGDDHPVRVAFRNWLSEHPNPTPRQLAESGYVAPHWPRPWGLDASPLEQLIIDDELKRAKINRPENTIGIGWAGPTLIYAGSEEQKKRYLLPILSGEEIWCQLFSEPNSGSDLASLSTRAVQDGDEFVITGQKIWTTYAHVASFGILLARTDPEAPKHKGISYFICPMDAPGIEIRPIIDMTGGHSFNQVFLDSVRIKKENLVGELNKGWELAKVTLANERVSLSSGGSLWGRGPTARDLLWAVKALGGVKDPVLKDRVIKAYIQGEVISWLALRQLSNQLKGRQPGPEASVKKALGDKYGQMLMNLAKDLAGPAGMLADSSKVKQGHNLVSFGDWNYMFNFSPALTIGGGTTEVQKNIIAERTLGLPKDIDPDASLPWNQSSVTSKRS